MTYTIFSSEDEDDVTEFSTEMQALAEAQSRATNEGFDYIVEGPNGEREIVEPETEDDDEG